MDTFRLLFLILYRDPECRSGKVRQVISPTSTTKQSYKGNNPTTHTHTHTHKPICNTAQHPHRQLVRANQCLLSVVVCLQAYYLSM